MKLHRSWKECGLSAQATLLQINRGIVLEFLQGFCRVSLLKSTAAHQLLFLQVRHASEMHTFLPSRCDARLYVL